VILTGVHNSSYSCFNRSYSVVCARFREMESLSEKLLYYRALAKKYNKNASKDSATANTCERPIGRLLDKPRIMHPRSCYVYDRSCISKSSCSLAARWLMPTAQISSQSGVGCDVKPGHCPPQTSSSEPWRGWMRRKKRLRMPRRPLRWALVIRPTSGFYLCPMASGAIVCTRGICTSRLMFLAVFPSARGAGPGASRVEVLLCTV
jgi:hypothetical protein